MADIGGRKSEHLAMVTAGCGVQLTRGTGFDGVRFLHHALPELSFDAMDTATVFRRLAIRCRCWPAFIPTAATDASADVDGESALRLKCADDP